MKESIVRTIVPLIVGMIVTLGLRLGVRLDEPSVTVIVTQVVSAIYYIAARWLETNVSPKWGRMLGIAAAPVYTPPADN